MSARNILIIALIGLNIFLDQITKFWIRTTRVLDNTYEEIIGDYLTLHFVENEGAFLGMGSDFSPTLRILLLLVLPIVVLLFVLRHIVRDKAMDRLSLFGFCTIIGGGLANIYDRIVYGSVTDFLHIDLGGVFRTGIFNVADMSVMFGMGLLLYAGLKKNKKEA